MKLTSLVVEGFRGFGRRQTFSLGDVNIIGGPNGFGKTSFFDSVLWCLFGSIPRLSGTRDFVHAGDICQNKFSTAPHFVSLTFDTPAGILSIRRTSNSVAATIDQIGITETDCLAQLGLEDADGISRFLRNFMLQQEKLNDFIRDLNPRGRYDSLVSMLEFQPPTVLGARLDELMGIVNERQNGVLRELAVSEERVSSLQGDVEKLEFIQKDISSEVSEQRYKSILQSAGNDLLLLAGISPEQQSLSPLRERVMTLVTRISDSLRLLSDTSSKVDMLKRLTADDRLAQNQESIGSQTAELLGTVATSEKALATTESDLRECQDEIRIRKAKVEVAAKAQGEMRAALAAVRAIANSDICPVCKRPIERDRLLEIIDQEMGTTGTLMVASIRDLNEQETLRLKLQNDAQGIRLRLAEVRKSIEELHLVLQERRRLDSLLDSLRSSVFVQSWRLFSDDIEAFMMRVTQWRTRVESVHKQALELSSMVDSLNSTALLPSKEADLKNAVEKTDQLRKASVSWDTQTKALNKVNEAISKSQVNLISAILESHRPLIRSLYARMQPHPLFTDLDFEIRRAYGEGELYFKVFSPERTVGAYPSTIFSASQLNILAVAVFLALNLRMESPLPVMMLDDPIHSMDDLNVLGFCDAVRQIKAKKQLFISTHSRDLYGLLLSKLRPSHPTETVKGFWFADWSEEGPTVREEVSPYVPGGIQWEDVKKLIEVPAA